MGSGISANSWSLIGAIVQKPEITVQPPEDVTCEEWRSLLPGIREQLFCLLRDPGLNIKLGGETIKNADAIKALRDTALWIEEMCGLRNEAELGIIVPDACGDSICGGW